MSCSFDLGHYEQMLRGAREAGYRFASFDSPPEPGDLLLRHDVDLALEPALEMAELEARLGVHATYFLMPECELYNLQAPSGQQAMATLRALGHRVGQHALFPYVIEDDRFDPVMSWHMPAERYMSRELTGYVNAMQEGYFAPRCYRSDSLRNWRHGCPCKRLAKGKFPWLQLLTHPEWWTTPGESQHEAVEALLEDELRRWLKHLRASRIVVTVSAK